MTNNIDFKKNSRTSAIVTAIGALIMIIAFVVFLLVDNKKTEKLIKLNTVVANTDSISKVKLSDTLKVIKEKINSDFVDSQFIKSFKFWVAIGVLNQNKTKWDNKNFDFEQIPDSNSRIKANKDIYMRSFFPFYNNSGWIYGKPIGILYNGQRIRVLNIKYFQKKDGIFYFAQAEMDSKRE